MEKLTYKFLIDMGFSKTHCGIIQMGDIKVEGPPASGRVAGWKWFIDDHPVPPTLTPTTRAQAYMLFGMIDVWRSTSA